MIENEPHHAWAVEQLQEMRAPLLTCEAVLAESFHLLRRVKHGPEQLFRLMASGLLLVSFRLMDEQDSIAKLMAKYRDLPMSLADACLVRLAELHSSARVFTLDEHFRIYRKNGRQRISLIMPGRN